MKKIKILVVGASMALSASLANAGVIINEYSKIDGPMSIVTSVVSPYTTYNFTTSVSRDTTNLSNLNVSFISGPSSFNLLSLTGALVTSDFSDVNGHIGTVVWNNQTNKGILSGTIDPSFSATPFNEFLSDFTSGGYDLSLTIKDTANKTTTIQSINSAFGFSTGYNWTAAGANELTLQELLQAPQVCGQTGCANLTQVTGFSATLSPFEFTASSVPEPSGLALAGLGAVYLSLRRKV